jgi:D-sedoheptulose 7-phosphate isomerase
MEGNLHLLQGLLKRYPMLKACLSEIETACTAIIECYEKGGKVLVCGNGGSSADSDHIVAELMKGFLKRRELPADARASLKDADPEIGAVLAEKLQGALPAIDLSAASALSTAFANDVDATLCFAQLTCGYGRRGDVLIGISTSGNAGNVIAALVAARVRGMRTIGLTGASAAGMKGRCDVLIAVPAVRTPDVQELHLPVYHCLCAMIEEHFFGERPGAHAGNTVPSSSRVRHRCP